MPDPSRDGHTRSRLPEPASPEVPGGSREEVTAPAAEVAGLSRYTNRVAARVLVQVFETAGAGDGARTRDLRRDRPAL